MPAMTIVTVIAITSSISEKPRSEFWLFIICFSLGARIRAECKCGTLHADLHGAARPFVLIQQRRHLDLDRFERSGGVRNSSDDGVSSIVSTGDRLAGRGMCRETRIEELHLSITFHLLLCDCECQRTIAGAGVVFDGEGEYCADAQAADHHHEQSRSCLHQREAFFLLTFLSA